MKLLRKFAGTAILAAATILPLAAAPEQPAMRLPKAVVETAKVTEVEDSEVRRYTGLVVSQAIVQIVPRVSGEILEVGFDDGSVVKPGQVLYRLDPIQYEAAVKSAEAKVAECKAKLEYASSNFERNQELYKKNAVSRDTFESTRATLRTDQASLLAAEAELIVARDNLKNTTITAPISGVAGVGNYTAGNYITPSSGTLVTIIQVQPVRVRFAISTADYLDLFGSLAELRKNGFVNVKLSDGRNYPVPGIIELINNEANRKTDTIMIYANFPNRDFKLLVGSTVSVTLGRKTSRKLPAVPPGAVMHDSKGSYVYIVGTDHKAEKRTVVLGSATATSQLLLSGVKPGETVISGGTHKAMPGREVESATME